MNKKGISMGNLPRPNPDEESVAFLRAILSQPAANGELKVTLNGASTSLRYKPLGWLAKSRCMSQATQYVPDAEGNMQGVFRLDRYYVAVLREMLGDDCPFPLTDTVMEKIPEELGVQLLTIIPDAFTTPVDTNSIKKAQGESLTEEG